MIFDASTRFLRSQFISFDTLFTESLRICLGTIYLSLVLTDILRSSEMSMCTELHVAESDAIVLCFKRFTFTKEKCHF